MDVGTPVGVCNAQIVPYTLFRIVLFFLPFARICVCIFLDNLSPLFHNLGRNSLASMLTLTYIRVIDKRGIILHTPAGALHYKC